MLGNLESMSLNQTMKDIIPAFDSKDFKQMKSFAHSLKGASAYIGASRLHYICYFIQEHFVLKDYDKMLEYYPSLVESAIEFKLYSRKIIAEHNSKLTFYH